MNTPSPARPPIACNSGSAFSKLIRQVRDNMRARWTHELSQAGQELNSPELSQAGLELNFSQYVTIKKLAEGMAKVTELARAAEVNPGAMTRILDQMEARGLIVRETDPADRRAVHIHLTEAGQAIQRAVDQCGQRVLDAAFAGLEEPQRLQLIQMLEHVRDNLINPET